MALKRKWIMACIFSMVVCLFNGCTKIKDPERETQTVKEAAEKEYGRYSCDLQYFELDEILEFFDLSEEEYEDRTTEYTSVLTLHGMTFENGSYIVAEEEKEKGVDNFTYRRNKEIPYEISLEEKERSGKLDFMPIEEAERKCREELERLGISEELITEEAYGISENSIRKMYEAGYGNDSGKIDSITKEVEAYRFQFQIACEDVPFYDKDISKGVLEYVAQPEIEVVYSCGGLETVSVSGMIKNLKFIGEAELISQEKAEDIILKAYGQEGEGKEAGMITEAEIVYARVPVKIKVKKGNQDLSEYECMPCWKITMQQETTWKNTKETELVTYEFLLQGNNGVRL